MADGVPVTRRMGGARPNNGEVVRGLRIISSSYEAGGSALDFLLAFLLLDNPVRHRLIVSDADTGELIATRSDLRRGDANRVRQRFMRSVAAMDGESCASANWQRQLDSTAASRNG